LFASRVKEKGQISHFFVPFSGVISMRYFLLATFVMALIAGQALAGDHQLSQSQLAGLGLAKMKIVSDAVGMQVRGKAFSYPPALPGGAQATLPALPAPNARLGTLPASARVPLYGGNPGQPGR
jgi:hypothetical protein